MQKVFSFSYQASQWTLLTSTWKGMNQNQITNRFLCQLHYQIYNMLNKFEYVKPIEQLQILEKKLHRRKKTHLSPLLDGSFF